MSGKKTKATRSEAKDSRLEWVNTLMPFFTSNNFLLIVACLMSLIGGSFLNFQTLACQLSQGQMCPETETATSIKALLHPKLQQEYGLFPITKPEASDEISEAELKQHHRNLSVAIASLCTEEELDENNGDQLRDCINRETLIEELRDMAGLAGKEVGTSIFNTLSEEVYVSKYATEIAANSDRNIDYTRRYIAHVCIGQRQESNNPGKFRYRLLKIYNQRSNQWGETQLRGIPTLPCGDNPQEIGEFASLPSSETEIIRIHPDVYRELFGEVPSPVKAKVKIEIEPLSN